MNNVWVDLELARFSFLQPLAPLCNGHIKAWLPADAVTDIRRTAADGTWLLRTSGTARDVAIIWSDFRVNGGSFGGEVARRMVAFLEDCQRRNLPLIMVMNSLGYRFMEGRAVFNDVFNLIPALDRYSRQQLVISVCHGQCLGLGAILFGLGHYRIGVSDNSTLNLTGPEVFRLFFGSKVDFESFASVDQQHLKTSLVHLRVKDLDAALADAWELVRIPFDTRHLPTPVQTGHAGFALDFLSRQRRRIQQACLELLAPVADRYVELFADFDSRLRVYLVECDGLLFGLLMNPPENTNNMITVRTLRLYQDAVRLFRALHLPLISFLDTPGVDPRIDSSNQDIIQQLIETNRAIIDYPFPKMGVWTGRGFGGANTLVIPRVYGSFANYVILERTTLGVMHESIIAHLLDKSKRMLGLWQQSREKEVADFQDLVDAGIATRAIQLPELRSVILDFLLGHDRSAAQTDAGIRDDEEICA